MVKIRFLNSQNRYFYFSFQARNPINELQGFNIKNNKLQNYYIKLITTKT